MDLNGGNSETHLELHVKAACDNDFLRFIHRESPHFFLSLKCCIVVGVV